MELFEARDHYIIQEGDNSLWCSRFDGSLVAKTGSDIVNAWNPVCLGLVHGVIGKFRILPDSDWRLMLIQERHLVGQLYRVHDVYRITKVCIVPLTPEEPGELDLQLCKKHHFGIKKTSRIASTLDQQQKTLTKTWNHLKSVAGHASRNKKKEVKDRERFERKVTEEILKMFNETDSFYYSSSTDLTSSLQRQHGSAYNTADPLWKRADLRFFWNRAMLEELVNSLEPLSDHWIVPVTQGYIQISQCQMVNENEMSTFYTSHKDMMRDAPQYTMTIISRRSRHRAGTRFKRRGVDESGAVANYVETEQIIEYLPHVVSFVQVRGSIPVYWSQSGYRYRPPPRLDRDESESQKAFATHMKEQLDIYQKVCAVNLVDQGGREKVLADAFLRHVLLYNSKDVTYVSYAFHDYCRGMRFENVSILTDNLQDIIKDIRYCWVDPNGMICEQRGVIRVNCVDCLDRTNVVQTAIARIVLETQCRKLGLLLPEEDLPTECRLVFQQMWANNGDTISRQYAGTVALKGDYTRTGERKFTGVMKDGMHSANRYFQNRFKDAYRQATIDILQGLKVTEDLSALNKAGPEDDSSFLQEKEEYVKVMIDQSKKLLLSDDQDCLGGWALIDMENSDSGQTDMDTILLLTQTHFYVASYDDEAEKVTQFQKIPLDSLLSIEIGPEPAVLKSKFQCIRFNYRNQQQNYSYTFRSTNSRLFNNIVIAVTNQDEAKESFRAIAQTFAAAIGLTGRQLIIMDKKLERKKYKPHPGVTDISSRVQTTAFSRLSLPRDASAKLLDNIVVGLGDRMSSARRTFSTLNPVHHIAKLPYNLKIPVKGMKLPHILSREQSIDKEQRKGTDDNKQDELRPNFEISGESEGSADELSASVVSSPEDDLELEAVEPDSAVLPSCGIIVASPRQAVSSMMRSRTLSVADDPDPKEVISHMSRSRSIIRPDSSKSKHRLSKVLSRSAEAIVFVENHYGSPESEKSEIKRFPSASQRTGHTFSNCGKELENPAFEDGFESSDEDQREDNGMASAKLPDSYSQDGALNAKRDRLYHPVMKTSFSDGAIVYDVESNHLALNALTNKTSDAVLPSNQPQEGNTSAFSRLKTKMLNVKLTGLPSPKIKSKQFLTKESERKRNMSDRKFQNYKTTIIEL
ncbi:phosphatidylinositide phosphatase SAC2 [Lingula anatina]|uniref:Phosphatidylinositide phosphatase SAC2 n=1 Tax=Lingula anatina TaxID=7574 RepID=A0A1S3IQG5_LINAN|nr:phosphatidylinositide phosphatase SAC2 [Lingula anatina]|eukprot:XP_013400457.1 phosphatidylinositide phosphatase SAC2 [Lingula anatina]